MVSLSVKDFKKAGKERVFDLLVNINKGREGPTFVNSAPPSGQRPKYVTGASLHRAFAIALANKQESTWFEQLAEVAHRLVQLSRSMYNEESYHHIILSFNKALVDGILLGITHFEDHAVSPLCQILSSVLKETGRYVCEGI